MKSTIIPLRVICLSPFKRGTALPTLINMVHYNHPEVNFVPYVDKNTKGDVLLGCNKTVCNIKRKIRKVVFVGSIPSLRKRGNMLGWDQMDYAVYLSNFVKNIVESISKSKSNSAVLFFGGIPSDIDSKPIMFSRRIEGPIHFVVIAKWYKRPYKRLKQILHFYNEYLKKEFPDAILNILGYNKNKTEKDIYYYRKSFHNDNIVNIFKNSHIQLIPTAFDTGPKTLAESLHYRVPFVCSNNCAGPEYIKLLGKCGLEVFTDPYIDSYRKYKQFKPLNENSNYNKKDIPYEVYLRAVKEIVNNFTKYTSWEFNDKFNYKKQSDDLYNILTG